MQFITFETHDFDQLTCGVPAWDMKLKQMGCGKFRGSLTSLRVGPISCARWTSSQAMICRGMLRQPSVQFTPVTKQNMRSNWRGFQLTPQDINIFGDRDVMDHVTSNEYESCPLVIESTFLKTQAANQWDIDLDELLRQRLAIRLEPSQHHQFHALPKRLLQLASAGIQLTPQDAIEQVMDVLFQAFLAKEPRIISPVDATTRQRVIARVNEYMAMHQNRTIYVSELCQAAQCSERTLQYSILERYGVTPKAYLQRHRLNAVRQELKNIQRHDHVKVRSIAKRWGFHHSGEFAASYRQLFGELPSETLQKSISASKGVRLSPTP